MTSVHWITTEMIKVWSEDHQRMLPSSYVRSSANKLLRSQPKLAALFSGKTSATIKSEAWAIEDRLKVDIERHKLGMKLGTTGYRYVYSYGSEENMYKQYADMLLLQETVKHLVSTNLRDEVMPQAYVSLDGYVYKVFAVRYCEVYKKRSVDDCFEKVFNLKQIV